MLSFPEKSSFPPYYEGYINRLRDKDVLSVLTSQIDQISTIYINNESKSNHRYAEGKWSVRELLVHMIDVERVFSYRILSISRGEKQHLPGFDHDAYIDNHNFDHIQIQDLINEFSNIRMANISMIKNLKESQLLESGIASNNAMSCLSMVYILAGHVSHHMEILSTKYDIN